MIAKRLRLSKGFLSVLMATAMVVGLTATLKAEPPNEPPGSSDHAIVPLGKAFDTDGRTVEGYAIIHYKRGFDHQPRHRPRGGGRGDTKCFAFLAKGARWKTTEQYVLDTNNFDGLTDRFVADTVADSLATWDTEVTFEIFDPEGDEGVDGADTVSPDGKNEVMFNDIEDPGAIAMTIVWGIFGGPPFGRELVEWDMVLNDDDFNFGDAAVSNLVMDLQNIVTHEVGHAAGMGHPDDSCTKETMYRFAAEGEFIKRDLNAGDMAGIAELYE